MNLKFIHARKEKYHTKICTEKKTQLTVRQETWVPVLLLCDMGCDIYSPGLGFLMDEERVLK